MKYPRIIHLILTFFYLIYRDLKVFTRRKSSLLLVFISPIIIMVLLGTTYSMGTNLMENSNIRGISLAVCDYDKGEVSKTMIQELKNSTFFDMDYFDDTFYTEDACRKKVEDDIYAGKYRVAVSFPSNFTTKILNGENQELTFLVDNSHTEVRNTVQIFMLAYVHEMSGSVGERFISRAWDKLTLINQQLSLMSNQLGTIENNATSIRDDLAQSQAQLSGVDTASVRQNIADLQTQISRVETVRKDIGTSVTETWVDIDSAVTQVDDLKNITASTRVKIQSTKQKLDSVLSPLVALQSALIVMNQTLPCPSPVCDQIQAVLSTTQSTISDLQSTRSDLVVLESSLDKVNTDLDSEKELLTRTKDRLNQAASGVASAEPEIASVKTKVGDLNSVVDQVEGIKQQSNQFFSQAGTSIDTVISNMDAVKPQITGAQEVLGQFTTYTPRNVVQPISLNGVDIYKDRKYIDFMMPGIIGLVVMFSSMLLASVSFVGEKKSGVFTRTLLTPTPLILTISSRIVSNLILSGIQIGILILVGTTFYNVQMRGDVRDTFIAGETVAFAFLTIGLLLGAFSRSENTAILASIAIGLPMLFLCGLLFPTELMPSIMRVISSVLPLTYGIDAMRNIVVYSMTLTDVLPSIGLLIGQGLIATWLSVKILKRVE